MDERGVFFSPKQTLRTHYSPKQTWLAPNSWACALVDLLTCWLVDYLNVRLLAFFVNFAVRINFSENDKENNIIFKTIILKSYGYRL